MSVLAVLFSCALQQGAAPPEPSDFELRCGVLDRRGQIQWERLGRGDGGVTRTRRQPTYSAGGFVTSGGVRVQTRAEGVKLDFASGAELLVSPSGRVHTRDGQRTTMAYDALNLQLADGAAVEIVMGGSRRPLRLVAVRDGATQVVLWRNGRSMKRRSLQRQLQGSSLVALGDGRVLYEVGTVGPMLSMRRVLAPQRGLARHPNHQVVVIGDLLRSSLGELPVRVPTGAVPDPRWMQRSRFLAKLANGLFRPGYTRQRPDGAIGRAVLPLASGHKLQLDVRQRPPQAPIVALGFYAPGGELPLVEWTTTSNALLHLVTKGKDGRPHYVMKGFDINRRVARVLPFEPSNASRSRARAVVDAVADGRATGLPTVEASALRHVGVEPQTGVRGRHP